MPKIVIETNGQDVRIAVTTEGHITVDKSAPVQQSLLPEEKPKEEYKEPPRYNDKGERLPSNKQIYTLTRNGVYRDDMLFEEAQALVGKIKSGLLVPSPHPLPWEQPKKKRGRPRKNGQL